MKMGDTKKALNMLKKIQPTDRSFVQAKKKQAQIYLDELKDRNNYTRCYLEILDAKSSVENFKMVAQRLWTSRSLRRLSSTTSVLLRDKAKTLLL